MQSDRVWSSSVCTVWCFWKKQLDQLPFFSRKHTQGYQFELFRLVLIVEENLFVAGQTVAESLYVAVFEGTDAVKEFPLDGFDCFTRIMFRYLVNWHGDGQKMFADLYFLPVSSKLQVENGPHGFILL
jgi:hypothetical protein